ncbi:MAG: methyltransferase domain-containing protein [Chloroflexota bacterium]
MDNRRQDQSYLTGTQYKDSSNLNARINLHRDYTQAEHAWQPWVFERLKLKAGQKVLECGCGSGKLWQENLDDIPERCHITLSDLSEGMVSDAKANLGDNNHHFDFQPLNIETLPFEENTFDTVIANHMLYHVPDIPKAITEVTRVLMPNGRFVAATNGNNHLKELTEIGRELFDDVEELDNTRLKMLETRMFDFRLQNGIEFLEEHFSQVDLHLYESNLLVTESAPLVRYVMSMIGVDQNPPEGVIEKLTTYLDNEISTKGHIFITKETGLFVAKM